VEITINSLGKKIKKLRKEQNLTQQDLAGNYFSKSYISLIERGKINPSIKALTLLAERLNRPVSYFLAGEDRLQSSNSYIIEEGEKLIKKFEFDKAYQVFSELAREKSSLPDFEKAMVTYYMGYIIFKTKGPEYAQSLIRESIKYFDIFKSQYNNENKEALLDVHIKLGEAFYILNRKRDSLNNFIKAKDLCEKYRLGKEKYYYVLRNLSIIYTQRGTYSIAIDYLNKLIEISKKDNIIDENILSSHITLSTCYASLEQYDKALEILNRIAPVYELIDNPKQFSAVYLRIARILVKKNDLDAAAVYINNALRIAENIKEADMRIITCLDCRALLAAIRLYKREIDKAFMEIQEVIRELESSSRDDNESISLKGRAYIILAKLYLEIDKYQEACQYLHKAIHLLEQIEAYYQLPEASKLLGTVYLKLNQPEKAQEYYDKAFELLSIDKSTP
jgi:tetratricopeptide (TPR) repeat protein